MEILLSGDTPSFQAAYFQSETWKKSAPFVQSVDINTVTLDETTGVVSFDASIVLVLEEPVGAMQLRPAVQKAPL